MQINKIFACSLVTACAVLSACTSDNIEIPKSELYAREFVKQFGVVDPNHDWNNATQGSVTVVTSSPTHVEVLADIRGERYIFADYHNVNGKETINFTIPKGVSELIVTLDGQQFKTQIGGTVDGRNRSRIVSTPTSEGNSGITAELCEEKDWMVIPMLNATVFRRKMPENCYNANRQNEYDDPTKDVHVDFSFKVKENPIIVRPLYWQTSHTNEMGFFYLDENDNPVRFPIYKAEKGTKGGDMSSQVLCWAPTETRKITIQNFFHDETFVQCMKNNGIDVVTRSVSIPEWNWNFTYDYPNIYSLDNFIEKTDAMDDHNMTFACREYLNTKGIINDRNADPEKRFNYVYRWHMVGNKITGNDGKNPYDTKFVGQQYEPKEDLEIVYTIFNYDYSKADGWSDNSDMISGIAMDDNNYPALISKGIKVTFDDISKTYGAYIKRDDGRYLYSMSFLNEKVRWVPKEGAVRHWTDEYGGQWVYNTDDFEIAEGKKAFRAATWIGDKYAWRYMSFEDGLVPEDKYNRNSCDFDMQDFVFIMDNVALEYGDPVEIIPEENDPAPTPKKYEWIIAAEDLGGSYDWDFNDLVASISLLSTNTPATTAEGDAGTGDGSTDPYVAVEITPLASGGTMPIYLMYTGDLYETGSTTATNGNFIIGKEFHTWFGVPTTKPANVDKGSENSPKTATSVTINAPKSFTLSKNDKYNANGSQNNMGGFWVLVVDKDEEYNPAIADGAQYTKVEDSEIYNKQNITTIGSPNDDKTNVAPQMICVGEEWYWPLENHNITLAYPHDNDENPTTGFKGWLTNPTIDDTWYTTGTKVEEHLFMRKKD